MNSRNFLILLVLLSNLTFGQEKSNFISMEDFDLVGKKPGEFREDYATYTELQNWAKFQGWTLEPDSGPIQNGIARMVSPQGFRYLFFVPSSTKENLYLHIELTKYNPVWREINQPYVLRIYVNRKLRKIVELYQNRRFTNPLIFELDPTEFREGRLLLEFQPSLPAQTGKFWGIWDMYLSPYPEKESWD